MLNYGESFGFSSEAAISELPGLIETVFPRRTPVLPSACYLALWCYRFADVSGRYWPQSSLTRQNCNFVDRRNAVVDMSVAIDGNGSFSDSRRSANSGLRSEGQAVHPVSATRVGLWLDVPELS